MLIFTAFGCFEVFYFICEALRRYCKLIATLQAYCANLVQFLPAGLSFYSFRVASGLPLFTIYFMVKTTFLYPPIPADVQHNKQLWRYVHIVDHALTEIGRNVNFRWTLGRGRGLNYSFNLILDFTVTHIWKVIESKDALRTPRNFRWKMPRAQSSLSKQKKSRHF
jgi:hypothetical protein